MRVLIIGTGYVGLPLGAELARRGHDVSGLRRNPAAAPALLAAGIQPLTADITDLESLQKLPRDFDWVVSCVASGGGGAEDYRSVYLDGMQNVLQWLDPGERHPLRFVYTSSTSVYGQNDGSLVDETSATEPTIETGRVLLETEQVLLDAARKRNFPALILRLAGIYGPGRGYWLKQFLLGEARLEGTGSRFLNMIHRDDVIGCIIAALERGRGGEIYNAVDSEPVSQLEFFQWLASALGKPLPASLPKEHPAMRKRGATNKRISHAKLVADFAYRFRYPNFRAGYDALIADSVKLP